LSETLFGCEVLGEVEYGAFGKTVHVREAEHGTELAFVRVPDWLSADAPRLALLREGCERARDLHHPNLARNLGLREERGVGWIGLAYHRGARLFDLVARKPLPPLRALDLCIQIAGALTRIHDRGWAHGDLRPADIVVDERAQVVILDFGLAPLRSPSRVTESLAKLGPPSPEELSRWAPFQSPEQARGEPADYRSDIFSLGALLHWTLTGSPPFQRDKGDDTLSALLRDPVPSLAEGLGPDARELEALQKILERSLARERDARYLLLQPSRAIRRESWQESHEARSMDEDLRAVRRAIARPADAPKKAGCLGRAALFLLGLGLFWAALA